MDQISFEKAFFISEDHAKNYENVVNSIGLEKLIPYIPFDKQRIRSALEAHDTNLNTLSIKEWDLATGIHIRNTDTPYVTNDWFFRLLKPFGVNVIAQAQIVCTLKQAAIMWSKLPD